jgi:hypothetical protein
MVEAHEQAQQNHNVLIDLHERVVPVIYLGMHINPKERSDTSIEVDQF